MAAADSAERRWDAIPTAAEFAELLEFPIDDIEVSVDTHNPGLQTYPLAVARSMSRTSFLAIGDGELDNLDHVHEQVPNAMAMRVGSFPALLAVSNDSGQTLSQVLWVQRGRFFNLFGDWGESEALAHAGRISASIEGWNR